MRKYIRKIMSCMLSLTMLLAIPAGSLRAESQEEALAAQTESAQPELSADSEMRLKGTNSFGTLLSQEIEENELKTAEYKDNGYRIADIQAEGAQVTVQYTAQQDCRLVVAFYNDNEEHTFASASQLVSAKDTEAVLEIDTSGVPKTFLVKVFLLDEESHAPLCEAYTNEEYTQKYQDFLAKTVEDFPADQVMNLDEDTANNFAVLEEDTVSATEMMGSRFYQDSVGNYVVENADARIRGLKAGDTLYYKNGESTWLVKVKEVQENASAVIITEDEDAGLEDFFSYIKIDAVNDEFYEKQPESAEVMALYNESGGPVKVEKKRELDLSDWMKNDVFDLTGKMSLTAAVKYYFEKETQLQDLECSLTPKLNGTWTLKGKELKEKEFQSPIGLEIPLCAGVSVSCNPCLVLSASAKLVYTFDLTATVGFAWNRDTGFHDISTAPAAVNEVGVEGKFYIGVNLKPSVELIHIFSKSFITVAMDAKAGVDIGVEYKNGETTDRSQIHDCLECLDGSVNLEAELGAEIDILGKESKRKFSPVTITIKTWDFYHSITYGDKGFGKKCPHVRWQTVITVIDQEEKAQPGVQVSYGSGLEQSGTTDQKGEMMVYLPNGSHMFRVQDSEGQDYTMTVKVKDKKAEGTIKITKKYLVTITVEDQAGNPAAGIAVNKDGKTAGITDSAGQVALKLANGSYVFSVVDGSETLIETVAVNGKDTSVHFSINAVEDGWKKAYREFLLEYAKDSSHAEHRFSLEYIDGDDVPELVISEGMYHVAQVKIITYYNNILYEVGDFGEYGTIFYCEKDNFFKSAGMNHGYAYYVFYKIEDGKSIDIHRFYDDSEAVANPKYEYNGQEITQIQYETKLRELYKKTNKEVGYEDCNTIKESNIYEALLKSKSFTKRMDADVLLKDSKMMNELSGSDVSDVETDRRGLLQHKGKAHAQSFMAEYTSERTNNDIYNYTKSGLIPAQPYLFLAVKDASAEDLLSPDNLLYINQRNADNKGQIQFSYLLDNADTSPAELLFGQIVNTIKGDLNDDQKVDLTDAQLSLKAALKIITLTDRQKNAADVTSNGKVTLEDAQMILKAALKIITLQ